MAEPKREQLRVGQKRGILAAVIPPDSPFDKEHALDELKGLAKTAGVKVVGELVQIRDQPHPGTCLGSGKIEELHQLAKQRQADIIVFDNNLTPSQGKNLEDELKIVLVDRSEVILDIFATHARSYEAKLQVELAQLQYYRTRLKRMWTHLERIQGGIGTGRGPGEKQIETDRRLIDKRIAELKKKLDVVEKRRERMVSQRREQTTVSLVGYTNAGKSTLMNALTKADVFVANQLFATLETRTRRWNLPHWGEVLLSDTVGFVRNLPHHLVASFRSTLEEARHADLLLHVVDASNPEVELQIEAVERVLKEIDVQVPIQLVFNKVDAIEDRSVLDVLLHNHPEAIPVSAFTRAGFERLEERLVERLSDGLVDAKIEAPIGSGRLLHLLNEQAEIRHQHFDDEQVTLRVRIGRSILKQLQDEEEMTVTIEEPSFEQLPVDAEIHSPDDTSKSDETTPVEETAAAEPAPEESTSRS